MVDIGEGSKNDDFVIPIIIGFVIFSSIAPNNVCGLLSCSVVIARTELSKTSNQWLSSSLRIFVQYDGVCLTNKIQAPVSNAR